MNRLLFIAADFLSRPPGFYLIGLSMVACTSLVPFGLTNAETYALSVVAIIITGIVFIQGYRDTAAMHAKLDEMILSLKETRNELVGLEHAQPDEIKVTLAALQSEARQERVSSPRERGDREPLGNAGVENLSALPPTGSGYGDA